MPPSSENFAFLAAHHARIEQVAANAERDWSHDPIGSLIRQRLFAEMLVRQVAAKLRIATAPSEHLADILDRLERAGFPDEPLALFHQLRAKGNGAVHRGEGNAADALAHLRVMHQLAVWFQRAFHGASFTAPPFQIPADPAETLRQLRAAVDDAEKRAREATDAAQSARAEADAARALADTASLERMLAEERADKEAADRAVWESLAHEANELAAAPPLPAPDVAALIDDFLDKARAAAKKIVVTEADVRRGIDEALRAAGWAADSAELTYKKGARPDEASARAIAEWPTEDGDADYVLFLGLRPVAVVEAKRANAGALDALGQCERYSAHFAHAAHEGPWGRFRVPLAYATNGRPYHRQFETSTGVWFRDLRDGRNKPRALRGWHSPDGVKALLAEDVPAAHAALRASPIAALKLRPYQNDAILAVERAIEGGATRCLLAMATGTGKTRTAIGLLYRLLEAGRFRRVLFLVDRTALGDQTAAAIKTEKVASEKTFAQIFGFKDLADALPDRDTRLHIATVQAMMHRVLHDDAPPPVDQYDCVIVDECHRGYTLDREMSDEEAGFRDQKDYVSRYRRVIDHFDAVKVALTATPALHTVDIFGPPVFTYSYTRAVLDKVLVPQEAPYRIVTELSEKGVSFGVGETVSTYDRSTGAEGRETLEDELDFDVADFNRRLKTPGFNRAVCAQLADEIDPHLADKTLVFCVDDRHADDVTQELKRALDARWGALDNDTVMKITGSVDRADEAIRRLRNERLPAVAVTVDLLTTGVDVPPIANLVFLRRVRSRILYEQMLGRATRLCPEIGKESFRVYDAVGQTELVGDLTDMKPTAVTPSFTFRDLAHELATVTDERARAVVLDQLVAKLRRKRRAVETSAREAFEAAAGCAPDDLIATLSSQTPTEAAAWLLEHPAAVGLLDATTGHDPKVYVHDGDDRVVAVRQEFQGKAPADYLASFGEYLARNANRLPALTAVTTRPSDLTRADLVALAEALARDGYAEVDLRAAWRRMTNEDVAATVIGHIRQRSLGDPLVPYAERVEKAVKKVLSARPWTRPQRTWIERLGKQLALTTVVDRAALDDEPFRDAGGFAHLDAVFGGEAENVLRSLADAVWAAW
ncbi:MAG: type I restriction-modification system endonuclease [Polyangiales bacterium]